MKSARVFISVPPLFYLAAAFASGIWLSRLAFPPFGPMAYMTLCFLSLTAGAAAKRQFIFLSAVLFLLLGVLFEANTRSLPKETIALISGQGFATLEGNVKTVPETARRGRKETVSFVLEAQSLTQAGEGRAVRGRVQVFLYNPKQLIRFGDRLRLRGTLEEPKGRRNPYTLDYKAHLAEQGIFRVFHGIGKSSSAILAGHRTNRLLTGLNRFRAFLRERLNQLLPDPYNALGSALILGFRKNIPRTILDDFARTGTAHLLSISGLHIALIGKLFYTLGRWFRVRRNWNLALTACFISVYTVLAGGGAPVLRSAIMGSVILIGLLAGEERNSKSAFFFSFLALLVIDPRFLFRPSFQLSFLAMASLIFLRPRLAASFGDEPKHPIGRYFLNMWFESASVLIGMFPALVWYFHLFSPVSFLANAVAIPASMAGIVSEFFLLSADFVSEPLGRFFSFLPHFFFTFTVWFVQACARIPFGHFYFRSPPVFFFFLYYGFLLAWIFLKGHLRLFRLRWAVGAALSAACIFTLNFSFHPPLRVLFFDLGKIEASFVSFSNGGNCLINTGRRYPSDQAYWVLRPFLMASGIRKLNRIFLTGLDHARTGGVSTLKEYFQVSDVLAPPESFSGGKKFQFGPGCEIEVLVAVRGKPLAFRIGRGAASALYLTSVQPQVFESLLKKPDLGSGLVFLPHHEYGMSQAEELFLARTQPRVIVSNQREGLSQLQARLESIVSSELFFIQNLGAVEMRFLNGNWNWRNFKT